MSSSIVEVVLIVFCLIIGVLSIFNLIDRDLVRDILTIISILLPLVYSYRRRGKLRQFASFFKEKIS